jgi:hypothetical protein
MVLGTTQDSATGEIVQELAECWTCKGWGKVPLFLVAPRSTRITRATLRKLDDDAVWRLCWQGSAREQKDAEREMRRRQSRGQ